MTFTPEALIARADIEEHTYDQKELPAMLRAGAEAMREVERLRLENATMARMLDRATGFTGGRDDAGLQRAIQGERERRAALTENHDD